MQPKFLMAFKMIKKIIRNISKKLRKGTQNNRVILSLVFFDRNGNGDMISKIIL